MARLTSLISWLFVGDDEEKEQVLIRSGLENKLSFNKGTRPSSLKLKISCQNTKLNRFAVNLSVGPNIKIRNKKQIVPASTYTV